MICPRRGGTLRLICQLMADQFENLTKEHTRESQNEDQGGSHLVEP